MEKRKETTKGFTLIELMITLVIAIVVLSLGIPGIARLKQNSELTTVTNDLIAAMSLARSEAIKRADIVKIEPDSSWSHWEIRVDDGDDTLINDDDDIVVRIFANGLPEGISLAPDMQRLVFNEMGSFSAFDADGDLILDPCIDVSSPSQVRSIIVSTTGRAISCKNSCEISTHDTTPECN